MSFGEALLLVEALAGDPSSHVAAALGGWAYPISRADVTLRDLYDLQHMSKAKRKPRPYPRPWPDRVKKTLKPGAGWTQDQIVAALRFAGHTAALPGEPLKTSIAKGG